MSFSLGPDHIAKALNDVDDRVSDVEEQIDAIEIPEVNLDEYATIEYVDDASERLQGQINDLVIEGTDLFRVAGEWNFRPLNDNATLENGFVKVDATGNWFEWEDPSTWTHITIPIKDQNNKSHPGLANIGAGEIIEYKGMHEAAWMTSRPAELVQENGVDAYKFQVTFVNGTNEGSRLIDGLLLNKYSTPPSGDPGGDEPDIDLPDDPDIPKLDESNTFTAKQVYDVDSGQALVIKKNGSTGVEFFGSGRIKQYGDQSNKNGNDLINRQNLDDAIAEIAADDVDTYTKDEANQMADELADALQEYAKQQADGALSEANTYTDEQIAAIPDSELPDTVAHTNASNHFTARQNIELDSGTALLLKKAGVESFKLFADGTAEQLIEHDNVKPSHMVTRKNLTDALDSVSLGSALEEADNNFKGSQSFRISGTHGSPIQVYAPKNGGGEQEIFAVSVVPANDDKVGERETESSAYYRGRIASDTSLVNKKYVDDAVESIDLEAYYTKEDAQSELHLRNQIFEEIFEDLDDAIKDLKITDQTLTDGLAETNSDIERTNKILESIFEDLDDDFIELKQTDQTLTDGLAAVNTDAAFLNKLNRFTARQKIDVSDSVALQITKNNSATLDVWSTGEVQQKSERPNSHPQQFVTRKNVEVMVNNRRPYSWADHTVAGDLTPGECFIAGNGNLYCHIMDANNEPICIDGTYGNGAKSVIYYRNAAGDAVELFSTTGMHCYEGSYIRFDGEEEVLKNAANSGMTHLESPLFI